MNPRLSLPTLPLDSALIVAHFQQVNLPKIRPSKQSLPMGYVVINLVLKLTTGIFFTVMLIAVFFGKKH